MRSGSKPGDTGAVLRNLWPFPEPPAAVSSGRGLMSELGLSGSRCGATCDFGRRLGWRVGGVTKSEGEKRRVRKFYYIRSLERGATAYPRHGIAQDGNCGSGTSRCREKGTNKTNSIKHN